MAKKNKKISHCYYCGRTGQLAAHKPGWGKGKFVLACKECMDEARTGKYGDENRLYTKIQLCEEMKKLRRGLQERHIRWHDDSTMNWADDFWICRTKFMYKGREISVINGIGTDGGVNPYGENEGLLEMRCQALRNEPYGRMLASDIFYMVFDGNLFRRGRRRNEK